MPGKPPIPTPPPLPSPPPIPTPKPVSTPKPPATPKPPGAPAPLPPVLDPDLCVLDPRQPTQARWTSDAPARSAESYARVVQQFDVENNPRYRAGRQGHGETYGSVFVWDVTRAMGCEVSAVNANALSEWLEGRAGQDAGWRTADEASARQRATEGCPVVAVYRVLGGTGVAAVVLPVEEETRVAQVSDQNAFSRPLQEAFPGVVPRFYWHE